MTLVWLINLHAYVHSLLFGFFWTFLLSSNVAKTYLSIPWEIDSVVGCTLEIIHLLPVCKGKAKMLKMKPSFLIFSIRLNIRTIYLKLVFFVFQTNENKTFNFDICRLPFLYTRQLLLSLYLNKRTIVHFLRYQCFQYAKMRRM